MTEPTCDACALSAANPILVGLAQAGCRECWTRQVARMPKCQREEIYRATPPDELAGFVADVRACFARLHQCAIGATVFTRAESDG